MVFNYNQETFLSINDIQNILPISSKTIRYMLKYKKIPGAAKLGKQWFIPESEFHQWLINIFKQDQNKHYTS